jgi:hypothetical protein
MTDRDLIKQPPAYHLRLNKAVDRFLLVEMIRHLENKLNDNFTKKGRYFGFGGPYLEDIRLMHENFRDMELFSIEEFEEVYKRQEFHRPCRNVRLYQSDYQTFLRDHWNLFGTHSVAWLDYTDFEVNTLLEFTNTISAFHGTSILRVTVNANNEEHRVRGRLDEPSETFLNKFASYIPTDIPTGAFKQNGRKESNIKFIQLIRDIFLVAAQQENPALSGRTFVPVSSTYYADGQTMFSLTGIVCVAENYELLKNERENVHGIFTQWEFANEILGTGPEEINLPFLTTKERLSLQKFLPLNISHAGDSLFKELGYSITEGDDADQTKRLLCMYAKFYRYYPYFIRGNP